MLATPSAEAVTAIGLTSNGLVTFDTANPGSILNTATFTGLGGDTIVDIDVFSQDNRLYGIAASGRLFTIDATTGAATLNTAGGVGNIGTVTQADFNPVANRLRVLSGNDNYRLTPGTGVFTNDGSFSYAAGDINFNIAPSLTGAAYTNSFFGTQATTLYSIDSGLDTLVLHPPPGPAFSSLTTVGSLTVNGLFVDFGDNVGFDIYSIGGGNTAYLSNGNALYELDLATGDLASLGSVGGAVVGVPEIIGLAVVPEPGASLLAAGAAAGLLLRRRRR